MQQIKKVISESELVSSLKNKDTDAFSTLYDNYSGALYGVITRIVPAEEIAQDILQDVFVKIWKSIDSYDTSKGKLFTWMLNVARNSAIDYARSKQSKMDGKIREIDTSVYAINKQTSTSINTDVIGLKANVSVLKEDYKILIDLVYFKGFTQEEAAKELNIPLGTVKTRIRSAIIQLRALLK